jgi:hypothetical protein
MLPCNLASSGIATSLMLGGSSMLYVSEVVKPKHRCCRFGMMRSSASENADTGSGDAITGARTKAPLEPLRM